MPDDLVIDWRDFISGPFRECPKCHERSFGLLQICGDSYRRRCRNCRHSQQFALWPITKQVVFIDQFAISNMMKAINRRVPGHERASAEPFWLRMFVALERVTNLQLATCPSATSHRNESLAAPYFGALKRMYEQLSHGAAFVDVDWIANVQLDTALTAWLRDVEPVHDFDARRVVTGPLHEWLDRVIVTVDVDYPDTFVQALRERRRIMAPQVADVFEGYRRIGFRDFGKWVKFEQRGASTSIPTAEKLFHERLLEQVTNGEFDPAKLYSSPALEQWRHIRTTIERTGLTDEAEIRRKIVDFICSDAFLNTPYNRISVLLWAGIAMLAVNGKKTAPTASIMTDIDNIAALMPYCDAMFLDRECAGLLRSIPAAYALPFSTKIFSRANEVEFLQYLAGLETNAEPQLWSYGAEVYGDNWPTAYTTMYDDEPEESR